MSDEAGAAVDNMLSYLETAARKHGRAWIVRLVKEGGKPTVLLSKHGKVRIFTDREEALQMSVLFTAHAITKRTDPNQRVEAKPILLRIENDELVIEEDNPWADKSSSSTPPKTTELAPTRTGP